MTMGESPLSPTTSSIIIPAPADWLPQAPAPDNPMHDGPATGPLGLPATPGEGVPVRAHAPRRRSSPVSAASHVAIRGAVARRSWHVWRADKRGPGVAILDPGLPFKQRWSTQEKRLILFAGIAALFSIGMAIAGLSVTPL